jgi:4a-hydroxytetrahydrobiopterin dehydratase
MAKPQLLTQVELDNALKALPQWRVHDKELRRELTFSSFVTAFGYLTSIALIAERLNHHAEIFNVYNRVKLTLTTHDAGGLTALDVQFATEAEKLLTEAKPH